MLEFPQSTNFGKKIPKSKFYDNADISAALKRMFATEIERVVWRDKFSIETLNVEKGEEVTEIELLQITLRQKSISRPLLEIIVSAIPYHLIFLLEYLDELRLDAAYSPARGKRLWYSSGWRPADALSLEIRGLNLDAVHENFIRQIAGDKLPRGESLRADVERERAIMALQKRIAALTRKTRSEKQFNRQVEFNRALREAKAELLRLES